MCVCVNIIHINIFITRQKRKTVKMDYTEYISGCCSRRDTMQRAIKGGTSWAVQYTEARGRRAYMTTHMCTYTILSIRSGRFSCNRSERGKDLWLILIRH